MGTQSRDDGEGAGRRAAAPGVQLERVSGPLQALVARGIARGAEDGVIELFLDGEEAAQGGMVSISMRVLIHCPACAAEGAAACARCGGKGTIDEAFSAWLAVPPGAGDGAVLIPSALLGGMVRPVSFRLRLERGA